MLNCDLNEPSGALNSGALRFELVRSGGAAGSFRESCASFVGEPQDTVARCSGKCERCCVYIRAASRPTTPQRRRCQRDAAIRPTIATTVTGAYHCIKFMKRKRGPSRPLEREDKFGRRLS